MTYIFKNRTVSQQQKKYCYDKQRLSKAAIPVLNLPGSTQIEVSAARTIDTFNTDLPTTSTAGVQVPTGEIAAGIASLNKTAGITIDIPKPRTSGIRKNKKWNSEAESTKKQLTKLQAKLNKVLRVENSFKCRLALASQIRKTAIFEMLNHTDCTDRKYCI
ncbi:uncharacterized protein [Choristoneura fumiferana]|uniref:uncharacterized protein n=1 Tax=Choristoneura fumiferana TaxID=7141 RepID=UPI003D15DC7C